MKLLTLTLTLTLLATGCGPFKPATAPAQKAVADLTTVDTDFDQVGADLAGILPLVPASVKPIVMAAQKTIDHGKAQNADAQVQIGKVVAHDEAMTARVNEYDNSLLGGRGERIKWYVLAGASLLLVIGIACLASGTLLTSGAAAPAFVGILMTVGHVCTSFFWFIGHGISVLFSEIFRRRTLAAQASNSLVQGVNVASIGGQAVQPLQPAMIAGLSTGKSVTAPFGGTFGNL